MKPWRLQPVARAGAACLLAGWLTLPAGARSSIDDLRRAVVKIHTTMQEEDYATPWQGGRAGSGNGSGFIVKGRRILTNAHVVSNTRFLEVQKDGHPGRYPARVAFIAHDCDLAVLRVDDPAFFADTTTLKLADALPDLNDEVLVLGYPAGGQRLSVTRGVVSRIDYSGYAHSGIDQHLVLQVDAAINPGNSGGPLLYRDRVVGLAFQGLAWADNIGYAIPLPVIERFLADIEDGTYHGYPELGALFLPARNPALRASLDVAPGQTGVVVYRIDPFGSAAGTLRPGDMLTAIDGLPIANDGNVRFEGNAVLFAELLERRQWGDSVAFDIWRDGQPRRVTVPLTNPHDPFLFRQEYDQRPRYVIVGGLVFSPLTRNYLDTLDRRGSSAAAQQLLYYAHYAKQDALFAGREEFVVLIRRLPHEVNTYAGGFENGILADWNGRPIRRLADIPAAAAESADGFHVLRFEGVGDQLVLDAAGCRHAAAEIRRRYGIPADRELGEDHADSHP